MGIRVWWRKNKRKKEKGMDEIERKNNIKNKK